MVKELSDRYEYAEDSRCGAKLIFRNHQKSKSESIMLKETNQKDGMR